MTSSQSVMRVGPMIVKTRAVSTGEPDSAWINPATIDSNPANVHGVRVTPQLFTTPAELDVLVKALKQLAAA